MEKLTKEDYKFAVYSQNACNVSGLVHDLSRVINKVWDEAREQGQGTDYVNNHPIVRLYIEQLQFLSRSDWNESYKICKEKGGIENES